MTPRFLIAGFGRRLVALLLLVMLPILVAGAWLLSRNAADHLRWAAAARLTATANDLANRVGAWSGDAARDLQFLAGHPDLVSMDPARQRPLLEQFRKLYPQITYAHTIGPNGIDVARTDGKQPIDYYDRAYFRRVIAGAPFAWETMARSRSTDHPALNQAGPIVDPGGKVVGVVVLGMDLGSLARTVGVAKVGRTGYSCVVDEQGRALAHPEQAYASTLRDLRYLPPVRDVIGRRTSGPCRFKDETGTWWLAYAAPVANGWSVVSFQQENEALAAARQTTALGALVTAVLVATMIVVAWMVTRRMVRPILSMTATAAEIAGGDWKRRIPEDRIDELGELARAFNQMVDQLESMYRSVAENVALLSTSLADLHTAHQRLQDIIEFLPDATFVVDADNKVIAWNRALEEMTGVSKAEMLGKGDLAYAIPFYGERRPILIDRLDSDAPEAAPPYDRVERRQATLLAEVYIPSLYQGTGAHVWIAASPLLDKDGRRYGAIESVRDISAHKRAEEQLTKFSLAVEQSPASVVITNPQGTIEYVNPKFTQVTGYSAAEAVGQSPAVLKSGVHPPEFYRNMWETLVGGREWRGELCNRRKDGTLFWEHTLISPIRNAQGEIARFMAVKEDITERKRDQAQIASLARFPSENPNPILRLDNDGRLLYGNRASAALLDAWQCREGERVPDRFRQVVLDSLASGRAEEAECRCGDRVFTLTFAPVVESADVNVYALDITNRQRTEEALREKEEQFRQAQKLEAVGALAGGVAHEFNNLLQAIQAFTRFALKGLAPDEQRYEDLQEVLKASERAASLTRQLLGFSRRQQFQPKDARLNTILADLEKMLRPLIGENIELQLVLADRPGLVRVDPTMIQQAVMNLCINARDAMPDGGKLLVKTEAVVLDADDCRGQTGGPPQPGPDGRAAGRYVRLTVTDTGVGMPPEVLARVFEPFFSTKEVGKGTGLGLAMVYGVVQQHAGMIRVRSEPGRGTAFEIDLPVVDAAVEAPAARPAGPAGGGTETILMAEDDPLVRAALVRTLREAGYKVLAAANGEEAVALFSDNSGQIALVLLDMIMPRMGGREAHERIRQIDPDVPVVYCTGYDSGLAKLDAAEAAALCVVQKPVDPAVLLATIRERLDKRSCCADA